MDQSRGIHHENHHGRRPYYPFTLTNACDRHNYHCHNHDNGYVDLDRERREDVEKMKSIEAN